MLLTASSPLYFMLPPLPPLPPLQVYVAPAARQSSMWTWVLHRWARSLPKRWPLPVRKRIARLMHDSLYKMLHFLSRCSTSNAAWLVAPHHELLCHLATSGPGHPSLLTSPLVLPHAS